MSVVIDDILSLTLAGLESGLHVRHIAAFDLQCCAPADELSRILATPTFGGFDQIPVRDNGQIVGVVEVARGGSPCVASGIVAEQMRPLTGSLMIASDAPLARFIQLAATSRYRLVVTEAGITGIVTWSDLLKLPVRLLVFTLVTHLEMVMMEAIRSQYSADDSWLRLLSDGRRMQVDQKWQAYRQKRLDPSLLEFTDFCDKRAIVKKSYGLPTKFERELKQIEELRNTVAHAGNYAESEDAVRRFSTTLSLAQKWITELESNMQKNLATRT